MKNITVPQQFYQKEKNWLIHFNRKCNKEKEKYKVRKVNKSAIHACISSTSTSPIPTASIKQ